MNPESDLPRSYFGGFVRKSIGKFRMHYRPAVDGVEGLRNGAVGKAQKSLARRIELGIRAGAKTCQLSEKAAYTRQPPGWGVGKIEIF